MSHPHCGPALFTRIKPGSRPRQNSRGAQEGQERDSQARAASRCKLERYATDQKLVARHLVSSGTGGSADRGDVTHPEIEATHDFAFALDEAEAGVGKFQLWHAVIIVADGQPD